jgi:hypothetical protein
MRGEEKDGRPPFVYWTCLWGVGLALAVVSIFEDFTHHYPHLRVGRDFVNLWNAGRLVTAGDPWCVFDIDCFRAGLVHNAGLVTLQNYSYPPHALFIAVPFSLLPYNLALALWTVLGSVFFILAASGNGGMPSPGAAPSFSPPISSRCLDGERRSESFSLRLRAPG